MEFERKRGYLFDFVDTTFLWIAGGFAACSLIGIACFFLPEFMKPVVLFPVVMYAVTSDAIAITCSMYFTFVISLLGGNSVFEISLYILLCVLGLIWVKALDSDASRFMISFLLGVISLFFPIAFSYFEVRLISLTNLAYGSFDGIVVFIVCLFLFRKIRVQSEQEEKSRFDQILAMDYSEVEELKAYSKLEFTHSLTVSKLCLKYAHKLDLQEELCAAAGFYYRLGRWKGEPHVENGVVYAHKLCFPKEVIEILSEYYGEEKPISTCESALVHIIDAVVIKIQVLNSEKQTNGWNRQMLVYQTLNEFSQSGVYDKSGLTMNMFLKIRDYLVEEELLDEFLS